MVSPLVTTLANSTYDSQARPLSDAADNKHSQPDNTENPNTNANRIVDTVSISDAARQAAQNAINNASTQYYEQFVPTHEGFSATALAAAVSNPDLESFSAGKSFKQVAADARAALDKNYERLKDINKPYGHENARQKDINSLFGDLDRRALYAVSSNEGGLFTQDEQNTARNKMSQQQGLAMGLYNGPINQKSNFIDPFLGDKAQQFKAGIQFLDKVSNEEKAGSIEFAVQRAGLQRGYESFIRDQGKIPEDLSTDHPLVNLILAARDALAENSSRGQTKGAVENADDLRNQLWFEGFEHRLDTVIQETRDLYLQ